MQSPDVSVVAAIVLLPFVASAATPLVFRYLGERTAYYAAAIALACFGLVASLYGTEGAVGMDWIPVLGIEFSFYVDGLSLLIGFLASGVGVLILTYSGGYMRGEPGQAKYYAALLAFMGSMLGVAFAADLIALFVFWELTSLSSYVLIGHYQRERSSRYAARKSMLITVVGGLFMLIGFVILHAVSGTALGAQTWDLIEMIEGAPAMQAALVDAGVFVPVLVLVGIGAAAKSAQFPLHIWLPNAMEAPTPVSAFLHSATMVKAGVYLVGRFRPLLLADTGEWTMLFATLGLVTMTVAAILAVGASDIKELLAYSTASHLGLIIAGFGFAEALGAETGAFHILNHAVFKAALFLVAGIIAHEAGTRTIGELGGLRRDLPVTAAVAVVASLSMAGVPPFNGFYSKELLFDVTYEVAAHHGGASWLYPAVAVFGSVFTFLYSIRFLMLFFGEKPDALGHVHRPPLAMLAPPVVLGALVLVISAVPSLAIDVIVQSVFESAMPVGADVGHIHVGIPTTVKPPVVMSAVTIGTGVVAYRFYDHLNELVTRSTSGMFSADYWYDTVVFGLTRASATVTPQIQTGVLRTYASWLFAATSLLVLTGYVASGTALPVFDGIGLAAPLVLVLLIAVIGVVATGNAPSHIAGVLYLSILGFMIAIFYILASAPDLALTQLVIETLVLVIFLLVLDRLPSFYGELDRRILARDGILSLFVGGAVFATVLAATAADPSDGIASFFVERAPIVGPGGGGGGNIVNVILVDFRAFDTLGEISVVGMAALSVITLIAMREGGEIQ